MNEFEGQHQYQCNGVNRVDVEQILFVAFY